MEGVNDCGDFDDLRVAMFRVGISDEAQSAIFALVAAVLWLGNVEFQEQPDESVVVQDGGVLARAAQLLQVRAAAGLRRAAGRLGCGGPR